MIPFRPTPASTLRILAATGGNPVELANPPHGSGCQVRVRNLGAVDAYVEFGRSGVTASVPGVGPGSVGVPVGAVEIFTVQQLERFVAVAVASGAPILEVTPGIGA